MNKHTIIDDGQVTWAAETANLVRALRDLGYEARSKYGALDVGLPDEPSSCGYSVCGQPAVAIVTYDGLDYTYGACEDHAAAVLWQGESESICRVRPIKSPEEAYAELCRRVPLVADYADAVALRDSEPCHEMWSGPDGHGDFTVSSGLWDLVRGVCPACMGSARAEDRG